MVKGMETFSYKRKLKEFGLFHLAKWILRKDTITLEVMCGNLKEKTLNEGIL